MRDYCIFGDDGVQISVLPTYRVEDGTTTIAMNGPKGGFKESTKLDAAGLERLIAICEVRLRELKGE